MQGYLRHYPIPKEKWLLRCSSRLPCDRTWSCRDLNILGISDIEGYPIGSMYAIYGNIYHQYTPNVSIYIIHGYTWILWVYTPGLWEIPKCQATKSAVSNRTPFFGGRPAVEEKKGLGPFAHRWKDLETWPLYFNGLVCWGKFKPESPIEIMGKSMVSG